MGDETRKIDWDKRFKIIKGICDGLRYLHKGSSSRPPIIHMNLVPTSIWLDDNLVPKIADFGLSRLFGGQTQMYTQNVVGLNGYMAPEYLFNGEITTRLDIYSLGMIILEIITGERNCANSEDRTATKFVDKVRQNWKTDDDITSMYPSLTDFELEQVKACIVIALKCLETDQNKRPSTDDIVDKLNGKLVPIFQQGRGTTRQGLWPRRGVRTHARGFSHPITAAWLHHVREGDGGGRKHDGATGSSKARRGQGSLAQQRYTAASKPGALGSLVVRGRGVARAAARACAWVPGFPGPRHGGKKGRRWLRVTASRRGEGPCKTDWDGVFLGPSTAGSSALQPAATRDAGMGWRAWAYRARSRKTRSAKGRGVAVAWRHSAVARRGVDGDDWGAGMVKRRRSSSDGPPPWRARAQVLLLAPSPLTQRRWWPLPCPPPLQLFFLFSASQVQRWWRTEKKARFL
ncbi:putative receptor-like protein kinase [Panicum miliaceum]|uniref:Receptor-like protein kinase n=1 Tax=Panicum miliaceum TaxID=4540 RepID=A0A3L6Q1P4_PANMI|nr:putative receptor-like protein kinase [Panicum miliaceum]